MLKFRKLFSFFTAITVALTVLTSPVAVDTEGVKIVDTDVFTLVDALVMGQGIANDGEYFYTSGAITALGMNALAKLDIETMELVGRNFQAIPPELVDAGFDHIGDISCYGGKIYASVEGEPEGGYVSCIVTFDTETLEPTGEIFHLPKEAYDDGVPWCAVNPQTGYLYASKWNHAQTLYEYDTADNMKLLREIPLSSELNRIQGGDFYNGTLYLSYDSSDSGNFKSVMSVNIADGTVETAFERNVGSDSIEAEGLTVYPAPDGSLFHILDYNKVASVFVRHYKIDSIN